MSKKYTQSSSRVSDEKKNPCNACILVSLFWEDVWNWDTICEEKSMGEIGWTQVD